MSDMPTDWWAWDGDSLCPLGVCEDFDEASDKADALHTPVHWIFSRESLTTMQLTITKELS
jgi:hypothetical protein